MIEEVFDSNFDEVLGFDCALVDFFAEWCNPCKALQPKVEQIASEFPNVKVRKLNIDENPDTPAKFGVKSIPTLILFKNGKVEDELVGNISLDKLKETIKKII